MDTPKLDKIVIEMADGKKLELSKEEAKELSSILSDLFGGDSITYIPRPYRYVEPYPWDKWRITYGGSGTGTIDAGSVYCTASSLSSLQSAELGK